jgi:DNA polymerase (family 10)
MTSKTNLSNEQLAALFEELADLLELSGENAFRIRAYRSGAAAIQGLPQRVEELIAQGFDLTSVDGIGATLAEKSKIAIQTGSIPALEKLRQEVPTTLRDVMKVPGLGAKKAIKLHQELGVMDLASLKQACLQGSVADLKGFGPKTQQSILQNIDIVAQAAERCGMSASSWHNKEIGVREVSIADMQAIARGFSVAWKIDGGSITVG